MANSSGADLSAPAEREAQHFRNYAFGGYRRADGLFDIEGRMTDTKSYAFPNDWRQTVEAGEPVHDMRIRLTLDEQFVIRDVECVTAAGPYEICPAITPAFAALKGERIGRGWSRLLRDKFGGRHGCVHHVEMLRAMATVAFQTLYGYQSRRDREAGGNSEGPPDREATAGRRPGFIDSCHALASDGEVVRTQYPQFYEVRK
ncbi:MAG TPA: DUF2889 domain-containing protein [Dongiaceae bacterium]|nr:DUF2889 domain-containing protein [Dongiaceae bacterium]